MHVQAEVPPYAQRSSDLLPALLMGAFTQTCWKNLGNCAPPLCSWNRELADVALAHRSVDVTCQHSDGGSASVDP